MPSHFSQPTFQVSQYETVLGVKPFSPPDVLQAFGLCTRLSSNVNLDYILLYVFAFSLLVLPVASADFTGPIVSVLDGDTLKASHHPVSLSFISYLS